MRRKGINKCLIRTRTSLWEEDRKVVHNNRRLWISLFFSFLFLSFLFRNICRALSVVVTGRSSCAAVQSEKSESAFAERSQSICCGWVVVVVVVIRELESWALARIDLGCLTGPTATVSTIPRSQCLAPTTLSFDGDTPSAYSRFRFDVGICGRLAC